MGTRTPRRHSRKRIVTLTTIGACVAIVGTTAFAATSSGPLADVDQPAVRVSAGGSAVAGNTSGGGSGSSDVPQNAPKAAGTVVGSQSYDVPAGALVVAPNGRATGSGSASDPLASLGGAVVRARSGDTIVLRGGVYHETVSVSKKVTIQAWPGEAVWFDGSVVVGDWVSDGGVWRRDNWTFEFDSSPTYTRGAGDNQQAGWGFVNENYPMAAHPDQMWVDGVRMRQVGSRGEVTAGTFFHDEGANRLYLGSNPVGHEVRASALQRALRVTGDGTVVRGIGFRRYAPSVPDIAAVIAEATNVTFEHVAILESATTGFSATRGNVTLRRMWVADSGMLGVHGNHADNLTVVGLLSENNNVERFNSSPVAGGMKVTRLQKVTVRNSVFRDNAGTGLWFDESVYDIRVTGSQMLNNDKHGVSLEISAKGLFADNLVMNNGGDGVKLNNISDVRMWNNTFSGNVQTLRIAQDDRRHGDGSPGVDPRYPNDPNMTWVMGPVELRNNVFAAAGGGAQCLVCAVGYATAAEMRIDADNDVYHRSSTSSPRHVVRWSSGRSSDDWFTSLNEFQSRTGQERSGVEVSGSNVVNNNGDATSAMPGDAGAAPLPADIANEIGQPANTRHYGSWN
jgi:trimeric autotransporter adhesin